ncbi:MAG: hypothetical protein ACK5IQ_09335 [Bacteroidales bacterium]
MRGASDEAISPTKSRLPRCARNDEHRMQTTPPPREGDLGTPSNAKFCFQIR